MNPEKRQRITKKMWANRKDRGLYKDLAKFTVGLGAGIGTAELLHRHTKFGPLSRAAISVLPAAFTAKLLEKSFDEFERGIDERNAKRRNNNI